MGATVRGGAVILRFSIIVLVYQVTNYCFRDRHSHEV